MKTRITETRVMNWQRIDETRWRVPEFPEALLIRVGDEMRELDGEHVHFYRACCGRCTDWPSCAYPLHEAEHIRTLHIPAFGSRAVGRPWTEDEKFEMLAVLVAQS